MKMSDFGAVLKIAVLIDVGDRLTIYPELPSNFMVSAMTALSGSHPICGDRLAEALETRFRFVLMTW